MGIRLGPLCLPSAIVVHHPLGARGALSGQPGGRVATSGDASTTTTGNESKRTESTPSKTPLAGDGPWKGYV